MTAPLSERHAAPLSTPAAHHIQIARIDHWFKNVFVLPGIAAALSIDASHVPPGLLLMSNIPVMHRIFAPTVPTMEQRR
jgi:hypothetical protein